MGNLKTALYSTAYHLAEAVILLAIAYGVMRLFGATEQAMALVFVILEGLAKLARSWDSIPVPDYVNGY